MRRDVGEEARRISAIRDAVVDGERERDDRPHRRSAIRRDDAIRDAADGEDRRLRWIDDRREAIDTERAEIRDGDRRAAERVGACATRADRCLELLAFFPQSGKLFAVRVTQDGNDEAGVERDRDPDIDLLGNDDGVAVEARA